MQNPSTFSDSKMLFFLFFFGDDFTTLVMTAIGTDRMRQAHLTAVAARDQVAGFEGIVRAPPVPASLGKLAFWLWGHGLLLLSGSPVIEFSQENRSISNEMPAVWQAEGL